jgi:hypothetical protein
MGQILPLAFGKCGRKNREIRVSVGINQDGRNSHFSSISLLKSSLFSSNLGEGRDHISAPFVGKSVHYIFEETQFKSKQAFSTTKCFKVGDICSHILFSIQISIHGKR